MHHLLAFAAAALDATAGNVQLNAVGEDVFLVNSNRFRIPENYNLIYSYLGGANLLRGRVVTPGLRARGFPQLYPLQVAVAPVDRPPIMDFRANPIGLKYDEDLEIQVTNSVAGDTVALVGVTQRDVNNPPTPSDLRWIRFTSTNTLTALTWSTPSAITFEDTLESGRYGIYGMGAQSADCVALRLVFNDQFLRPGFLAQPTIGLVPDSIFNKQLGLWGMFRNTVPPQIQGLGTAAGAEVITGFMLVSKLTDT